MIRIVRRFQNSLYLASKPSFCSSKPAGSGGPNQNDPAAAATTTATVQPTQQQQQQPAGSTTGFQPRQSHNNRDQNKKERHQHTNQHNQQQNNSNNNNQQQHQQAQAQQGSKIQTGTEEEIRKSIQKSVGDFAAAYKLNLTEKKAKAGKKIVIEKKENATSLNDKKASLLSKISETKEELNQKNIVNMPIAQQILQDRLKAYGMQVSDAKRMKAHLKDEAGVDFAYVEPRNLEILNSHIHRQSEEMETLVSEYLGLNETLTPMEKLDEWRQEQAMKHIDFTPETMGKPESFYPGSPKGPHPQDDPLFYVQWYEKNCPIPYKPVMDQMAQIAEMRIADNHMPSFIKKWIRDVKQETDETLGQKQEEDEEDLDSDPDQEHSEDEGLGSMQGTGILTRDDVESQLTSVVGGGLGVFFYKSGTLPRLNGDNSSMLSLVQNDQLPEDTSPEEELTNCEGNITFHSGLQDFEIPPFPEKMSHYVTHYQIPVIETWSIFRQFPNMHHWWKTFYEMSKSLSEQPLQLYQYRGLPSVYTYFHTMPDFARSSVIVQNVARCFEFHRHDITYEQKMMALNFAAKFTLPVDDLIGYAAQQMIISNKHFLTAKEEDKLKTVNQFYYEADPEQFAIHLAHEEHTTEQIESYEAPKRLTPTDVEETLCDLPLEFYDNEDGFWDEFIREKNNRNHNAFPVTHSRPFFKH